MRRRAILYWSGGTAIGAALPALAQTKRVMRIGYLTALPTGHPIRTQAELEFVDGMKRLGWTIGRDLVVDYRYGASDLEQHFANAKDLVQSGVDLIITTDNQQTTAALRATRTVPIWMAAVAPIEAGFAKSLARPGGNLTGIAVVSLESQTKPIELLREMRPALARLGVPTNAYDLVNHPFLSLMQAIGKKLGIAIVPLPDIRDGPSLAETLVAASHERVQAMTVPIRLFLAGAGIKRIRAWAIENDVMTWGGPLFRGDVLLAHGASNSQLRATGRRQIDKLLRGANPADMPIEEPTEYEVVLSKSIANAMGLKIPNAVLLKATEVID